MSRVEVVAAEKAYGPTPVLRALSLRIEAGEFMVLLGPSGCGKSTLLHAIAGLDELDTGRVLIDGRDVTGLEPKDRGIAMVFQSYALYPTMTVRDNLGFGLRMARIDRAEIARRIGAAADLLQIGNLLDRKPAQLSGGQRQRVAIGRAIVRKVSVFLFDEPLSNLDAQLRTEMRVELKRLHDELGATMVYVTHDQTEAMTMASRIAVLRAGAIEQCDVPQALYDRPANLFVAGFVGSPTINTVPAQVRRQGADAVVTLAGLSGAIHGVPGTPALTDGTDVVFAIRPEDLQVAAPDAPEGWPVQLLLRETLGAETLVWCAAGAHRLCLRLPPDAARELPTAFRVRPAPGKSSIFDRSSGMRID